VFFLLEDRLSCTSAVKHTIHLEPGTVPIKKRPYRLPESQRKETDRQVTNLLEEGVIVESNSPWNSPILVMPKGVGADGEQKMASVSRLPMPERENNKGRPSSTWHYRNT